MYNVIQLTPAVVRDEIFESMTTKQMLSNTPDNIEHLVYMEAVFIEGKQSVEPIVECFQELKDILDAAIKEQEDSERSDGKGKKNKFDPVNYWRDPAWKNLEDKLRKIFGFRNVEIHPFKEKYLSKDKMFETKELNACVYNDDRYPIDGLITDKGFYDKTHSINIQLYFTLGIIKELSSAELVAVLLHEFGHAIDPALVHISYTETNILTKYLTDRANKLTKQEKRLISKMEKENSSIFAGLAVIAMYLLIFLAASIPEIILSIREKIIGKEKVTQEKLNKVRKLIQNDKSDFTRQNFSEAFADNFARMYGYGPQLAAAFKKFDKNTEDLINSRFKKEKMRQKVIMSITADLINDVHKTDVHRIRNLINEYKKDIDDPNTCQEVKKQLQEDLNELEKIFDEYLNNFSEFQNRVNKTINEELQKKEDNKNKNSEKKKEAIKEGVEYFDESKAAYQKLMKAKESLNPNERREVIELFGTSTECSFAKDKDGYYCYTHRCRSKSYPTLADIPKEKVDFVRSTS